jgi:hypothetical protein
MSDDRSNRTEAGTALDDPGTAQVLLFVGWIPPAITSLIAGSVGGWRTRSWCSMSPWESSQRS